MTCFGWQVSYFQFLVHIKMFSWKRLVVTFLVSLFHVVPSACTYEVTLEIAKDYSPIYCFTFTFLHPQFCFGGNDPFSKCIVLHAKPFGFFMPKWRRKLDLKCTLKQNDLFGTYFFKKPNIDFTFVLVQ